MADVVQKKCDFKYHPGTKREKACGKDVPDNESTVFSVGPVRYETDLCADHKATLLEDLEPYTSIARNVQRRYGKVVRKAIQGRQGAFTTRDVRNWMREQGVEVSDTGRVPEDWIKRFMEAQEQQHS
ncbi:Lsr2 family protein [Streptomyces sp. MI02-2A]|uniref:Lsr2 family DNA-binding protein n=1 Tax=Streptomyces sp. MI02-2A TaxID=3028688 RepID=UPI0029A156DF|nr:histone-like nucleoid-structuring protein Lsr2 [Streptomyces sp. MI02-2A]MDX3260803.1 Lsr2 family protein [Streptomyces sp. MI02-2A]